MKLYQIIQNKNVNWPASGRVSVKGRNFSTEKETGQERPTTESEKTQSVPQPRNWESKEKSPVPVVTESIPTPSFRALTIFRWVIFPTNEFSGNGLLCKKEG